MAIPDTHRAELLAEQAVDIIKAGSYDAPSGAHVDIASDIANAVTGTREHGAAEELGPYAHRFATHVEVTGESTLAAARRLVAEGQSVVALNFGSGKNPGGGFLAGATAQEESLCRASALYACLRDQPMYGYHQLRNDPFYSDRVIYSPNVPVFRDDDGALLEAPYRLSFLTSPAVNARLMLERNAAAGPAIEAAMRIRARRVLEVAAAHEHDTLVLGAWGAGVFGNAPEMIAAAFGDALEGPLEGVFRRVVFAILEGAEGTTRATFERRFPARHG